MHGSIKEDELSKNFELTTERTSSSPNKFGLTSINPLLSTNQPFGEKHQKTRECENVGNDEDMCNQESPKSAKMGGTNRYTDLKNILNLDKVEPIPENNPSDIASRIESLDHIGKILNSLKDKVSKEEEIDKDDIKKLLEFEFEAIVNNMRSQYQSVYQETESRKE